MAETCPWCFRELSYMHAGNSYSHATLVEIRGVYDGGLFYADMQEGGCGRAWHRWEPDSEYGKGMHSKAQPYLDQWNESVRQKDLARKAGE